MPIAQKKLSETATVYGTVIARPGDAQVVSLPYEASITHVLVTLGEPVRRGTILMRIAPSPTTRLNVQQARAAYTSAAQNLGQVQQEYDQHLAVSTQLIAAKKSAAAAGLQLHQLEAEGAASAHAITAPSAGIVDAVDVRDGQLAAAGNPLISIALRNRLEVRLGVEPEDAPYLRTGELVTLQPVHAL